MPASRKNWPIGQCPVCLGWGERRQYTACPACAKWRRAFPEQKDCRRCGHINHVSREGLCRSCLQTVRLHDPGWVFNPVPGRPVQLGFLVRGVRLPKAAPPLLPAQRKWQLTAAETLDEVVPTPAKWTWLTQRPLAQPVSPHLVDPAQLLLFEAHRDWSCLAVGALDQLPSLTPAAEALAGEFQQHARARGWNASPRNAGARTLRILLAWVGADAPIHEADIRALSQRRSTAIRRVLQFLDERGMVTPDPARQGTAVARAIVGDPHEPHPLPTFWSDQYGLRIQYVGHGEGADGALVEGKPSDRDFAVVYTRGEQPVGALVVGRPRDFARLRREIERTYDPETRRKEKR